MEMDSCCDLLYESIPVSNGSLKPIDPYDAMNFCETDSDDDGDLFSECKLVGQNTKNTPVADEKVEEADMVLSEVESDYSQTNEIDSDDDPEPTDEFSIERLLHDFASIGTSEDGELAESLDNKYQDPLSFFADDNEDDDIFEDFYCN
uniref:Uncharacterized protein n=1 Tax=Clytia hemisphaerica TaxID=252671 RepID=A0A7M5VC42_9CNID